MSSDKITPNYFNDAYSEQSSNANRLSVMTKNVNSKLKKLQKQVNNLRSVETKGGISPCLWKN